MQRSNESHYNLDGSIKLRHDTSHKAWAEAQRLQKKHPDMLFMFYPCRVCKGFHVGNKKRN